MFKVQALREFTYKKFDKIKNLERHNKDKNEKGKLYANDTFECTKEMVDYLTGECGYVLVKVIEVIPDKKAVIEVDSMAKEVFKEFKIEEPKTTRKRKTSKK